MFQASGHQFSTLYISDVIDKQIISCAVSRAPIHHEHGHLEISLLLLHRSHSNGTLKGNSCHPYLLYTFPLSHIRRQSSDPAIQLGPPKRPPQFLLPNQPIRNNRNIPTTSPHPGPPPHGPLHLPIHLLASYPLGQICRGRCARGSCERYGCRFGRDRGCVDCGATDNCHQCAC